MRRERASTPAIRGGVHVVRISIMEVPPERGQNQVDRPSLLELEVYRAVRAHELMLNEATSRFEHAAIAPLLLINGGGAVAFLTLLGALESPKSRLSASTLWAGAASTAWAVGLITAALAASLGLRAQRKFSKAHRLQRQQVERLLLNRSPLMDVVAPSEPDWKAKGDDETTKAKLAQKLYGILRWASMVAFLLGAACAAVSVT
jgi:hypothetical protein